MIMVATASSSETGKWPFDPFARTFSGHMDKLEKLLKLMWGIKHAV